MSDQNEIAQPPSSQEQPDTADGAENVDESADRLEEQERFKRGRALRAGVGRQSESDKSGS